jgi:lipid II:glycine glycyltransferase (peptidoglycan interpeptide bridge formation enzyme)
LTNKELYRSICLKQNDLPLFLQDWWLDIACKKWDVAVVKDGDRITGVWPYQVEQKMGVSLVRTPVLTPYLGPYVFFPPNIKQSKYDNYEHEIISSLLDQIPDAKVWFLAIQPGIKQVGLFRQKGFEVHVRQTFLINLQEDEQVIFSKLHEEYRRKIRRAESDTQITNDPTMLAQLYNFQKATLDKKQVKTIASLNYIQRLFNASIEKQKSALWVARKEGVVQAIVWNLWDECRAYYLVGAKNPDIKDNRAVTALLWHSIKHSKELGKLTFDFEGSIDAGVERFFSSFGGKREIYLELKKNKSLLWRSVQMVKGK